MREPTAGQQVEFCWPMKESLLLYMRSDPSFEMATQNGASYDEQRGIVLPAVVDDDGTVRALGSIALAAHEGMLLIVLRNLTIEGDAVWVDEINAAPGNRIRLVEVHDRLVSEDAAGRVDRLSTRLTEQATYIFGNQYGAGSGFSDITLIYTT